MFFYKNISLFVFLYIFLQSNVFAIDNSMKPIRPKVNKYTQKRTVYGCKRPKWGTTTKTITLKCKNIIGVTIEDYDEEENLTIHDCLFSTRELVLFNTSTNEPKIALSKCYKNGEARTCCKVVEGQWDVFDGEKDVLINDPSLLEIDHVLPYSYLRLNMKNCKQASLYYNYLPNLKPELSTINKKKSNILCPTKQECLNQQQICKNMSIKLKDRTLCVEINKININNLK